MRNIIIHAIYAVLIVAALYVAFDYGRFECEVQNMEVVR